MNLNKANKKFKWDNWSLYHPFLRRNSLTCGMSLWVPKVCIPSTRGAARYINRRQRK